jgi:hypothetical protein
VNFIKGICIVQNNFKNISCEELCTYIGGVPDLTRIGFPEK